MLEADVEHARLPAEDDVARHLDGHRRLAGALRAADEQQLSGAQPTTDRLVERREAERNRLVLVDGARADLVGKGPQHFGRGTRLDHG